MTKVNTKEFRDFIISTITTLCDSYQEEASEFKAIIDSGMNHFKRAFTSPRENVNENYQMLEFLGDSTILSFITYYLYRRFPQLREPKSVPIISRLKGNLVATKVLSEIATSLNFESFLVTEVSDNFNIDAFLEDTFEAFIGALCLSADEYYGIPGVGYGVCYKLLKVLFDKRDISLTFESTFDNKSAIKELIDAHPELGKLVYNDSLSENISRLYLGDILIGSGHGKNNKIRQQAAAKQGLVYIKDHYNYAPKKGNIFTK